MGGQFFAGFSKCSNCDAPVDVLAATCPYCYTALRPWSMNSPWVFPALVTFVALLLCVIIVDTFAGLGILQWFATQLKPEKPFGAR